MQVKQFELNPVQRRTLVQLWASSAERALFAEMSKQWMDGIAERMVKRCEPEELLALREARSSVNEFFASVHQTAVAYGLPAAVQREPQAPARIPGVPFGPYGRERDGQEVEQEEEITPQSLL